MEVLPVPVYPVGPSIPLPMTLGDDPVRRNVISNVNTEESYLKWLDAQQESSVLNFGWATGKDPINNNDMDSSPSLVVPWCNQLMVLCHSSVGGFWTHCGWNSTLEGVYAGVPMLTYPAGFDQITNRTLIVDCWRIGMKIMKAERLVNREEIALIVKKFMNINGDNEESKEMRTRASEFKKVCRQALANLDDFIRNILEYHASSYSFRKWRVTMESSSKINRLHVVAMPYPGRGHINPMMNFCKLLTTKFSGKHDIRISFVVTEEWLGFLQSLFEPRLPPQIQLCSIANVIPSELGRGLDHSGFSEAVRTKMEDPFEQFLDQLQQEDDPVSVGNRRSIPVVSLWPLTPSVFSIVYHIDLLKQNGHYPIDFSSDELIDYIPGVSPIRSADMPASLDLSRKRSFTIAENVCAVPKAHCLLLTTYYD
ncbi:hypothetical protein C5167_030511 [Papaver somniferum]|nr:hypothetical protein C5167_030511 [Papaver somniferum]